MYLEPCQTSANNFFANFFSNVIFVVWCETYFNWKLFAFLFKVYIKESQICDTLPKSKMELFVTIGVCKVIFCKLMILYKQYCSMSVFILCQLLTCPILHRVVPRIWDDAFCDNNYCQCCVLLGNGIARAVSFNAFLVFLCHFLAKSISFQVVR